MEGWAVSTFLHHLACVLGMTVNCPYLASNRLQRSQMERQMPTWLRLIEQTTIFVAGAIVGVLFFTAFFIFVFNALRAFS